MNLVLIAPEEVDGGARVTLRGRRAEHLLRVLRVEPGARVRLGVVRGATGEGEVLSCGEGEVTLALHLDGLPPPAPPIELVLALPRPKALPRLLAAVASMSVARIDLVNAWRVDKAYLDSPRLDPASLREAVWLGCEQGATTWVPQVQVHRRFLELLAEVATRPAAVRLVAHPAASRSLEEVRVGSADEPAVVALGPDGGFIDPELASLQGCGFAPVRLGPWVLRTELAAPIALAELALLRRLGRGEVMDPRDPGDPD